MSIVALLTILVTFINIFFILLKLKNNKWSNPILIFNMLWLIVILILQINTMEWYRISEEVYTILFIGLISFNIGAILLSKIRLKKSKRILKNEEDKNIRSKAGKIILIIQIVLCIATIPILVKAIKFINLYGTSYMRTIVANSIEMGYLTAKERVLYIHLGIFPLMQACTYLQIFLWAKEKIPGWHLIIGMIDIALISIVTVGRWEVFYYAMALICASYFNNKNIIKKRKSKRMKLIAIIAIFVLLAITILRHSVNSNFVSNIVNIVAEYFCCGPALLQVMINQSVDSGLLELHYGQSTFYGVFAVINFLIQILTLGKYNLNIFNGQEFVSNFFEVGVNQTMNAYPTWYYYFMQDYGYFGIIICSMIIGAIAQKYYKRMIENNSLKNQLIYFYLLRIILFSSIWLEFRRTEVIATIIYTIILVKIIVKSTERNKNEKKS